MRPRVFATRLIPENGLEMVREAAEVRVWEAELPPPRDVLVEEVRRSDGILTLLTDRVDVGLMDVNPHLRVVSNYAVGFDNIDIPAATVRGIPVGNTPGVLTDTTADFAFALLAAAARRIVDGVDYVRQGRWRTWGPQLLLGPDIHHATLGIVGFGRIGQAMARRAAGFDMRILYHDSCRNDAAEHAMGVQYASLDTLFRESDFISLHTDLNPRTRGLLDREAFARMKPTAVVINTARGPIVDQDALYEALRAGTIAGAALDVTDPEPIPPDSPLNSLSNCLIVPHIASASFATRAEMARMAAANLIAGLRGERLPNCVNPEVYEGLIRS